MAMMIVEDIYVEFPIYGPARSLRDGLRMPSAEPFSVTLAGSVGWS